MRTRVLLLHGATLHLFTNVGAARNKHQGEGSEALQVYFVFAEAKHFTGVQTLISNSCQESNTFCSEGGLPKVNLHVVVNSALKQ